MPSLLPLPLQKTFKLNVFDKKSIEESVPLVGWFSHLTHPRDSFQTFGNSSLMCMGYYPMFGRFSIPSKTIFTD